MKNKIINAYIYSYASLLVIIASYKIIALLLHKNYMMPLLIYLSTTKEGLYAEDL